jgi:hypothetical protein
MSWDGALRPALRQVRTWERTSSLDVLSWCSPKTVDLYRYWDARRGLRPMPRRADIDPVDMRAWLSRVTLVDVDAATQRFRYRLVGTEVVALRGFDPTGRSVEAAWTHEDAQVVQAAYRHVTEQKAAIFCHAAERWHYDYERDPVVGVMLLPLSNEGEKVDQILGYLGDSTGMFDPVI